VGEGREGGRDMRTGAKGAEGCERVAGFSLRVHTRVGRSNEILASANEASMGDLDSACN